MSSSFEECPYKRNNETSCDPATNLPTETELQKQNNEAAGLLSTERTASTIPRAASSQTWSYPSPRMFYNALLRKGYHTRPEDIQVMVDVHNFLNEQVWSEVVKWETKHRGICGDPKLKRFMGRPQDLSPRARFFSFFFGTPRPFDRHDWTVDRCGQDVRYIIDYYSGPHGEEGTFYCDVRPALDSWQAFIDRSEMFWREKLSKFKEFFKSK